MGQLRAPGSNSLGRHKGEGSCQTALETPCVFPYNLGPGQPYAKESFS